MIFLCTLNVTADVLYFISQLWAWVQCMCCYSCFSFFPLICLFSCYKKDSHVTRHTHPWRSRTKVQNTNKKPCPAKPLLPSTHRILPLNGFQTHTENALYTNLPPHTATVFTNLIACSCTCNTKCNQIPNWRATLTPNSTLSYTVLKPCINLLTSCIHNFPILTTI